MTQSTNRLTVVVGAVAILALLFGAVLPVLAQTGTGDSGGGTTATLQDGDTLGGLVSRYNLTDNNLRQFFAQNQTLTLQAGQTVRFPAGVTLNLDNQAATATPTTGDAAVATATPVAGGDAQAGDDTYVTQEGDTLATVLNAMGFQADAGDNASVTNENLRDFVNLNSGLRFTAGQTVSLPAGIPQTGSAQAGALQNVNQDYTVVAGDTLQSLADRYGLTVQQLLEANPTLLQAGTSLNIPVRQGTLAGDETLGSLISRNNLSGNRLVNFFAVNGDLDLADGQVVCIPATSAANAGGQTGTTGDVVATATPMTGDVAATATPVTGDVVATATPSAGDVAATATPTVGDAAAVTATPMASDNNQAQQANCANGFTAYTVQDGDTLDSLVGMMDVNLTFNRTTDAATAGSDNNQNQANIQANNQRVLQQFVNANRDLTFEGGQAYVVPGTATASSGAGVPVTGGQGAGVTGEGESAVGSDRGLNLGLTDAPRGTGIYIVQSGETVESVANKFGVQPDDIYRWNGGLRSNFLFRGQRILIPGVEAPGLWQNHLLEPHTPSQ